LPQGCVVFAENVNFFRGACFALDEHSLVLTSFVFWYPSIHPDEMTRSFFSALLLGAGAAMGTAPALAADPQVAQSYAVEPVAYEQGTGFYATIGLGAQWPQGQNVNGGGAWNGFSAETGYGGGFSGEIGVGYDFGAIRTELTYGYSQASANNLTVNALGGVISPGISGNISKNDVLVSAYWDIATGSRWVPYVGGGIGYTNLSTPNISAAGYNTSGGNSGNFGYQAKVGVSYVANRNVDVFLEGVYQGANSGRTISGTNAAGQSVSADFGSFNSWGAKLGARWRFGGEPAPVAVVEPAPAPAPAPEPVPAPAPEPIRGLW
jgi:outer membrane protein W